MEIEKSEPKVYELGFHLVPTIAEDAVEKEFDAVKAMVSKVGGEFISEGKLELINLTYAMSKTVKAIKSNYSKAYFSWVKFEVTADQVDAIKKDLDASTTVLRYLLVSTVAESTLYADKKSGRPAGEEGEEKGDAIDQAVEELVTN